MAKLLWNYPIREDFKIFSRRGKVCSHADVFVKTKYAKFDSKIHLKVILPKSTTLASELLLTCNPILNTKVKHLHAFAYLIVSCNDHTTVKYYACGIHRHLRKLVLTRLSSFLSYFR